MPEREIYLLSPRALSPETIAVAFAKTSRSPESFRAIAAELSDEKSAQFHEKWVVGYGHASVAEHAVLHIAFENVSRSRSIWVGFAEDRNPDYDRSTLDAGQLAWP